MPIIHSASGQPPSQVTTIIQVTLSAEIRVLRTAEKWNPTIIAVDYKVGPKSNHKRGGSEPSEGTRRDSSARSRLALLFYLQGDPTCSVVGSYQLAAE
jgi:hypothetical protein